MDAVPADNGTEVFRRGSFKLVLNHVDSVFIQAAKAGHLR